MREYQNSISSSDKVLNVPLYQKMREYQNSTKLAMLYPAVPLYQKMREYQNANFIILYLRGRIQYKFYIDLEFL